MAYARRFIVNLKVAAQEKEVQTDWTRLKSAKSYPLSSILVYSFANITVCICAYVDRKSSAILPSIHIVEQEERQIRRNK